MYLSFEKTALNDDLRYKSLWVNPLGALHIGFSNPTWFWPYFILTFILHKDKTLFINSKHEIHHIFNFFDIF